MPINTAFDGLEFDSLDFSYNRYPKELSEEPRFVAGENGLVTLGGKCMKRGGTKIFSDNSGTTALPGRIDRLWAYENLSGVTYLVASVWNFSVWALYYTVIDNLSWTLFTNTRNCNSGTQPHEATFSRGIMFIRTTTTTGGEKLGTITFNTNSGSPVFSVWGMLGPTTPAPIVGAIDRINMAAGLATGGTALTVAVAAATAGFPAAPFNIQIDYENILVTSIGAGTNWTITRAQNGTIAAAHTNNSFIAWLNWTASAHPVVVNFGWLYSYCYKNLNGQYSSRAPVETNPDNKPSSTGPFINLIPKITVTGLADTTNFPSIVILRTTDGGGTFYELATITNTGAGNITFEDKFLASASGNADPQPDNVIDGNAIGPTLTSNSPPPSTISPNVVGTDTIIQSSPIVTFQGRIWYAIQNILFYSGNEEISSGIPEESFPSGNFGNYFRFTEPIINVTATTYSLYIFTSKKVYSLTGTTRETFSVRLLLGYVGAAGPNAARACTPYRDSVVWLTDDFRIAIVQGKLSSFQSDYYNVISDPLFDDLITLANAVGQSTNWDIKYWSNQEKEYIIVMAHDQTDPYNTSLNKQWIYDVKKSAEMKKDFWFVPWSLPISACMTATKVSTIRNQRPLVFSAWDFISLSGSNYRSCLTYWDETGITTTDRKGDKTALNFTFSVRSNLFSQPAGNHLNALRKPGLSTTVDHMIVDRTSFPGDSDPIVKYYTDDLWTSPELPPSPELPERRPQSIGYTTLIYPINQVVRRFGWEIVKPPSAERFELQSLAIEFNSDAGA